MNIYNRWISILVISSLSLSFHFCVSIDLGQCEQLNCLHDQCEDQSCLQGCKEGYALDSRGLCTKECKERCAICPVDICTECKPGFYGKDCQMECTNCFNRSCDRISGVCTQGCAQDFTNNPYCNVTINSADVSYKYNVKVKEEPEFVDHEADTRNMYIYIAASLISAVIVIVVILIVFVVYNRTKSGDKTVSMMDRQGYKQAQTGIEDYPETAETSQ